MSWRMALAAMALIAPVGAVPVHSAAKPVPQAGEIATAMAFLTALGQLNFDSAGQFLGDDVVLDLPFAGKGLTVTGRTDVLHFLQKTMGGSVGGIAYRLEHAYPSPEAGAVVMELSTQRRSASGRDYTNRLVVILEFRHGKISLFREYFNPASLGG